MEFVAVLEVLPTSRRIFQNGASQGSVPSHQRERSNAASSPIRITLVCQLIRPPLYRACAQIVPLSNPLSVSFFTTKSSHLARASTAPMGTISFEPRRSVVTFFPRHRGKRQSSRLNFSPGPLKETTDGPSFKIALVIGSLRNF